MDSSSTPFLANNAGGSSNGHGLDDLPVDDTEKHTSSENKRRRLSFTSKTWFRVLVHLLALWGLVSLTLQLTHLITPSPTTQATNPPPPDVYHPSTLPPNLNLCTCGPTTATALSLSCVYDPMAAAWLPPHCRDPDLTSEFERSGPGPGGSWSYFADSAGTHRLSKAEVAALGEVGGTFWASRDWHIAHCLFYWQKFWRMRETGAVMEQRFDTLAHIRHCTRLIRNPVPEHGGGTLIEVDVAMNGSSDA